MGEHRWAIASLLLVTALASALLPPNAASWPWYWDIPSEFSAEDGNSRDLSGWGSCPQEVKVYLQLKGDLTGQRRSGVPVEWYRVRADGEEAYYEDERITSCTWDPDPGCSYAGNSNGCQWSGWIPIDVTRQAQDGAVRLSFENGDCVCMAGANVFARGGVVARTAPTCGPCQTCSMGSCQDACASPPGTCLPGSLSWCSSCASPEGDDDAESCRCRGGAWSGTRCCGDDTSETYCDGQGCCLDGALYLDPDSLQRGCEECARGSWLGGHCCGDDGAADSYCSLPEGYCDSGARRTDPDESSFGCTTCAAKSWLGGRCCGDDGGAADTYCALPQGFCEGGARRTDPDESHYGCTTCAGKVWLLDRADGREECCGDDGGPADTYCAAADDYCDAGARHRNADDAAFGCSSCAGSTWADGRCCGDDAGDAADRDRDQDQADLWCGSSGYCLNGAWSAGAEGAALCERCRDDRGECFGPDPADEGCPFVERCGSDLAWCLSNQPECSAVLDTSLLFTECAEDLDPCRSLIATLGSYRALLCDPSLSPGASALCPWPGEPAARAALEALPLADAAALSRTLGRGLAELGGGASALPFTRRRLEALAARHRAYDLALAQVVGTVDGMASLGVSMEGLVDMARVRRAAAAAGLAAHLALARGNLTAPARALAEAESELGASLDELRRTRVLQALLDRDLARALLLRLTSVV